MIQWLNCMGTHLFINTKYWEKKPKCPWTNEGISKQWYTHVKVYYSVIKKEWIKDTCSYMNESQWHYAEWRKLVAKGYIFSASTDVTFREKLNCKNRESITQGLGWGEGLAKREAKEKEHFLLANSLWWNCSVSWLQWWLYEIIHMLELHTKKVHFYYCSFCCLVAK